MYTIDRTSHTNLLNNNIPRIIGASAAHYGGQNGISSIDSASRFAQPSDNWIISSSDLLIVL